MNSYSERRQNLCKICGQRSPEFVKINNTDQYSDIEISVSNVGLLRVRNIKRTTSFPMCGRMFNQLQNSNICN